MTNTNPLLRAARAALTELTTSEAQLWCRDRAKSTGAGVKAIAHKSMATVARLLKPSSLAEPEQAIATDSESVVSTPEQGTKGFLNLRIGNSLEEQIEPNQPAMRLLEQWIHSANESPVDSDDELDNFQKIIDSHRPVGQKVFSASDSDVNQS